MATNHRPSWVSLPPSVGNIVTCLYPNDPKGRLRPALVLGVAKGSQGDYAVHIAFGTKTLKKDTRGDIDLIIEFDADIAKCGIAIPTRFDLENTVAIQWGPPEFDCWTGRLSPIIGCLPKNLQIECGWKLYEIENKSSQQDKAV